MRLPHGGGATVELLASTGIMRWVHRSLRTEGVKPNCRLRRAGAFIQPDLTRLISKLVTTDFYHLVHILLLLKAILKRAKPSKGGDAKSPVYGVFTL
jgi:hypothetical protein